MATDGDVESVEDGPIDGERVAWALRETEGNASQAAEKLGRVGMRWRA